MEELNPNNNLSENSENGEGLDFRKLIQHEPYELEIGGEKISIHDGVFAPDSSLTNSPFIILNNLPNVSGKEVLDMGTGTGIIALVCARNGANVVAVDSDDKAIENTKENVQKSGLGNIEVVKSNLFENISGKFDYIFANLPILDEIWDGTEKTASTVERFLTEAKAHLNTGGSVYVPWFSVSDIRDIQDIANQLGYKQELITESKLGFDWYLLTLS